MYCASVYFFKRVSPKREALLLIINLYRNITNESFPPDVIRANIK
jgi:hypothetical protein